LQLRSPLPQAQAPFWQLAPLPQTFPQVPQFCESVMTFAVQDAPLGFAQLVAKSASPKQATSADKKGLRTVMFNSFN
jgi:hypothetical protein